MSTLHVWLAALGLEQYAAVFQENDIDLEILPELAEKDLAELGVSLGHRKKILKALTEAAPAPVIAMPTKLPVVPAAPNPRSYTPKHLIDKILHSRSALEGERKQVTVLFADIQGSMQLAMQIDPEQWHALLERYFAILADAVHRFEGTVNQYTGDGIMALFGAPIAHEDHARRGCYAALQGRDQLRAFADDLRVSQGLNFSFRIGLNSGDVVVGKIGDDLRMDYTAQGATVGIAQRIEQLAAPGHVYLSGATERLVAGFFQMRPMGKTDLKGLTAALPLFELEAVGSARNRLDVAITRGLSRFVGRATEMQTLEAGLAHAERGHGQVIGIVGDPGLGKSRLCFEFVAHCRRRKIPAFEAHCPAHGKNIPYLPILELFRNYFEIKADDDAAQSRKKIAGTLLLLDTTLSESLPVLFEFMGVRDPVYLPPRMDAEAKQRQLYELMHRIVRAQDAQGQLTVTLIDDLHWVDSGSDGFVNQLVNAVAGRRSLIILNFRPEYIATFAAKAHYQQLPLVPLGDAPLRELISDLIGQDESVTELSTRIIQWTSGNPFYTEELINALIESGDLQGHAGHYRLTTTVERLLVPTSVRAVLAARIDRLPGAAKRLLQTAAVIGKDFSGPLLEAVADLTASEYPHAIERLKAGDFIFESALYPVFEYAFKHPLTHEVAYQSQLQSRRTVVHGAVARALEAQAGGKLDEWAGLLAHHSEAAGHTLAAARWHRRAAEWAGHSNFRAAFEHWQRVRSLAKQDEGSAESPALIAIACSQILSLAWRLGTSAVPWAEVFEEGGAAATRAGDLRTLAMLNGTYAAVCGVIYGNAADYFRYASVAVEVADRTIDSGLRCASYMYLIYACYWSGKGRQAERLIEKLRSLAGDNPLLGTEVSGFSPLLSAQFVGQRIEGFTRDALSVLRDCPRHRQLAADNGFPDAEVWWLWLESELRCALGDATGALLSAPAVITRVATLGLGNEVIAILIRCYTFAVHGAWEDLLATASEGLRLSRDHAAFCAVDPQFFAHVARAALETGQFKNARDAAEAGVRLMRESKVVSHPQSYAMLARAQIALRESAAEIAATLDEYASLLAQMEFHLFEGELHELRARLADREGHRAEQMASLALARDCYARFGMAAHVARVDGLTGLRAAH